MPHPLVVVAGVAIVLGAGYLVVNELSRRSGEEEWYQNYCAMVRAESQERTARRRKEDEEEEEECEEGADEKEDAEVGARRKDARTAGLRRRITLHAGPDADHPLIDLSQHSYPPSTPSRHASPPPQPRCDSDLIFAAPPTSPEPLTRLLPTLSPSSPPLESVEHPAADEPSNPFLDQPISPAVAEDSFSDRSDDSSVPELISEPQASPPLQQERSRSTEGSVVEEDSLSELDWTDLGSQCSHSVSGSGEQ